MRRIFRLWRVMARDVGELGRALARADRPAWLLPATVGLAIFALEPLNFAIPGLGLIDDFVILPLLLRGLIAMSRSTRPPHASRRQDERVVSIQ